MRPLRHVLAGILLLAAATAAARESDPTPAPTPTPTPRVRSLADLARRIRLHRPPADHGTPLTITNHNLGELGRGGHLTVVEGGPAPAAPRDGLARDGAEGASGEGAPTGTEAKRQYWRQRYREQLKRIEEIRSRIAELDRQIPALWTQFYSWDDPAYRDGVIKPKLDQALAERDRLAKQLPEEEAKLGRIREEARRDGALPGWFRNLDRD